MTENAEATKYEGGGLKGPLYWLAGVVTGKLALNAIQGGGMLGGGHGSSCAVQAAQAAVQYELARKDSTIAQLQAEKATDQKLIEVYAALREQDKAQDVVVNGIDKRLSALETSAPLREQIVLGKVNEVAALATSGIAENSASIQRLAAVVGSVTKTVIPNTSVCPGWGNVTITPQGPFTFPPPGGATPAVPA